jgi:hypothetical protein
MGSQEVRLGTINVSTNQTDTDHVVQARLSDYGSSITTADFVPGASLSALPLLATFNTSGMIVGNNVMTESGTNLRDNINTSGFTRILLHSDLQTNASDPGQFRSRYDVERASCVLEVVTV